MPVTDLTGRQVLLLSPGPRASTGYSIEIVSVRERGDKLMVTIREQAPGLENHVEPGVTFPYRLVSLPAGRTVYVNWLGR